jgi:hypothetical protein
MSNFFGSFALTVPGAANSVGVNLSDPAGGAAGNGTYTLMTFQAGQFTGSNNASSFFTSSLPSPNSLNGATIAYHLADDTNTIQDGNPSAATRVIMTVTGGPSFGRERRVAPGTRARRQISTTLRPAPAPRLRVTITSPSTIPAPTPTLLSWLAACSRMS